MLALLDDIATVLDDVALMTKVAAKKTAGVLGDDLALNAQQVSGVRAARELPVVFAVFKGSAINKMILVPVALLLSAFLPSLITPLLMLGGAYLCFEGFEKVSHRFLHGHEDEKEVLEALHDPDVDLAAFEAEKIKGAIRTDFVLSAEIIVIAMGSVQTDDFVVLASAVVAIAVLMTFGVYGLVAAIVKIDDLGYFLVRISGQKSGVKRALGNFLVNLSPMLMKALTVIGTVAMFLVGGGILAHGIPGVSIVHHFVEDLESLEVVGGFIAVTGTTLVNTVVGVTAGAILVPLVAGIRRLLPGKQQVN